ncbi:transposase [Sphingopyxis sp. XHP0097]|uniref:Transposase n=1 Tax=Sphingopyxis jiangsuensis TaxID=2871171 RepID=A0ABS7MC10_9SPHN|nr:transposase [Sphingopyxis jiangsuensis]
MVRERGVTIAQASRDLDVHANVLRKWVRELAADPPGRAFPGHGQMKPEQMEIDRLRRELAKLKAERDILKKPPPSWPTAAFGPARDSSSSRSTEGSGRWHGSARRSEFREAASMPGWSARRRSVPATTR